MLIKQRTRSKRDTRGVVVATPFITKKDSVTDIAGRWSFRKSGTESVENSRRRHGRGEVELVTDEPVSREGTLSIRGNEFVFVRK